VLSESSKINRKRVPSRWTTETECVTVWPMSKYVYQFFWF